MAYRSMSKRGASLFALLFMLMMTFVGQALAVPTYVNPEWAKDFYGQVKFQLTDDPEYAKQMAQTEYLKGEVDRLRGLVAQKQLTLKQKSELQASKLSELKATQKTITADTELVKDSQKEIELQNTKITSSNNAITASEQTIRNKTNELITYNNQLDPLKEKLASTRTDVDNKTKVLDATIAKCQELQGATFDCLNDDASVALAKQKLAQAKELEKYLSEQVAHFNQLAGDVQKAIDNANATLVSSKEDKKNAEAKIVELNALIAKLNADLPVLNDKAATLTAEVTTLQNETANMTAELNNLTTIEKQQALAFDRHLADFNNLKQELINQIIEINHTGRNSSMSHGAREGIETASNIGTDLGQRNARPAGLSAGEAAGRDRDFKAGSSIGEQEGTRQGMDQGTVAGREDGHRDGYREAGDTEGRIAGSQRADRSDAATVGSGEGRNAGISHAQRDGLTEGNKRGEKEAVNQLEAQVLANVIINGQYAGAFDTRDGMPGFPGSTRKYYNENITNSRAVLRLAYIEGYRTAYDLSAERTYYDNVSKIYKQAYDLEYSASFNLALSKDYKDSFESGRQAQFKIAYDRQYKPAYDSSFRASKALAIQNPDRNSVIFKSAFQSGDAAAYASRYAEIRKNAFDVAERDSYSQNLSAQIENFRIKRFNEVVAVYTNYPILKFIGNSLSDAGVSGVGGKDGIFQPGEKVAQDVTIANFSSVAAVGVKLVAGNGQSVSLPSIPGKSVVTVKGALLDQVPFSSQVGSNFSVALNAKFDLTANEKSIQGRYFADASKGLIAAASNTIALRYPMDLALSLTNPLIVGKVSGLNLNITNKSNRSYLGNVTFELSSSLGSKIIAAPFSGMNVIDNSAVKSDAQILVADQDEVFSDVDFTVVMKQDGVVIGEIKNAAKDYVKASYVSRVGSPVIVMKSSTRSSRQLFKDLMSELGGAESISILDMAGGTVSQSILESASEMKGKTLFVINDNSDSLLASLNKLFALKNVFVAFINDDVSRGSLAKATQVVPNLKNATSMPVSVNGLKLNLISTSPILTSGLESKVSAVEIGMQNIEAVSAIASVMKLSDDELLSEITKVVNAENFFALDAQVKLLGKAAIIRTLEDVMSLSHGDKSDLKRFKDDDGLFMNKFKSAVEDGASESRMATSLLSFALYGGSMKALEDIAPMNDVSGKVRRKFEKSIDDMINAGFLGIGKGSARQFLKKSGHKDFIDRAQDVKENFYPF